MIVHSDDGRGQVLSRQNLLKDVTGCTGSEKIQTIQMKKKKCQIMSSTQESVQKSNEEISNIKSDISETSIQHINLLQISDRVLTTNGKDLNPYWSKSSEELSRRLWLPTRTGGQGSVLDSSSGSLDSSELYWKQSSVQLEKERILSETSWKLSQSSPQDTMGVEAIITRKVKLSLTVDQKKLFRLCSGTHRYFYNKAIEEINKRYNNKLHLFKSSETCIKCKEPKTDESFHCLKHRSDKIKWNLQITLPSIRKSVMKSDSDLMKSELWQKAIPYDTRQLAVSEAVKAFNTSVASKRSFQLHYKKRNCKQSFWVDGSALKNKNGSIHIFVTRLKNSKLHLSNNDMVNDDKFSDTRIINDRGTWYILYTYKRPIEAFNKPKYNVVSLDPGIRTFQTGYSPDGLSIKFGENQIEQIRNLHKRIDKLKSDRTKIVPGYCFGSESKKSDLTRLKNRVRKMTVKQAKLEKKVYDVTSNLHNQVSAYLTDTFECILLPEFGTSEMVKRCKIQPCTKRIMNSLSFYKFKEKLKGQCIRKNRHLHIVSEAFTTKTCGNCGQLNDIKTEKIYKCPTCNYELDRDVHGSRNILIRFLSLTGG
jgi:putative transposase